MATVMMRNAGMWLHGLFTRFRSSVVLFRCHMRRGARRMRAGISRQLVQQLRVAAGFSGGRGEGQRRWLPLLVLALRISSTVRRAFYILLRPVLAMGF